MALSRAPVGRSDAQCNRGGRTDSTGLADNPSKMSQFASKCRRMRAVPGSAHAPLGCGHGFRAPDPDGARAVADRLQRRRRGRRSARRAATRTSTTGPSTGSAPPRRAAPRRSAGPRSARTGSSARPRPRSSAAGSAGAGTGTPGGVRDRDPDRARRSPSRLRPAVGRHRRPAGARPRSRRPRRDPRLHDPVTRATGGRRPVRLRPESVGDPRARPELSASSVSFGQTFRKARSAWGSSCASSARPSAPSGTRTAGCSSTATTGRRPARARDQRRSRAGWRRADRSARQGSRRDPPGGLSRPPPADAPRLLGRRGVRGCRPSGDDADGARRGARRAGVRLSAPAHRVRALIGWMDEREAALTLAGRREDEAASADASGARAQEAAGRLRPEALLRPRRRRRSRSRPR